MSENQKLENDLSIVVSEIKDLHAQIKADLANGQENNQTAKSAIAKADDALLKYNELGKRLTMIEQKGVAIQGSEETEPKQQVKSVGQIFAETVRQKGLTGDRVNVDLSQKDLTITTGGGWFETVNDKAVIRPYRDEQSFLDLIPVIKVGNSATSFEANKETKAENNASFVEELAQKPVSHIEYGTQTIQLKMLATLVHMSRQVFLNGGDDLRVDIDNTLYYFLRTALESQVLLGDGQGQNLNGLINQANNFTNLSPAVSSYGAIGKLRLGLLQSAASRYRPDAIIVSAYDWAAIELEKDDVGHFLVSDPRVGAAKELWGVRVFDTFSLPPNKWVINDFTRTTRLYRKERGVNIGYYEQNSNNVEINRVTVRAEEEIGFGLLSTAALVTGDYSGDNP